jgi:hypothetical protein
MLVEGHFWLECLRLTNSLCPELRIGRGSHLEAGPVIVEPRPSEPASGRVNLSETSFAGSINLASGVI